MSDCSAAQMDVSHFSTQHGSPQPVVDDSATVDEGSLYGSSPERSPVHMHYLLALHDLAVLMITLLSFHVHMYQTISSSVIFSYLHTNIQKNCHRFLLIIYQEVGTNKRSKLLYVMQCCFSMFSVGYRERCGGVEGGCLLIR